MSHYNGNIVLLNPFYADMHKAGTVRALKASAIVSAATVNDALAATYSRKGKLRKIEAYDIEQLLRLGTIGIKIGNSYVESMAAARTTRAATFAAPKLVKTKGGDRRAVNEPRRSVKIDRRHSVVKGRRADDSAAFSVAATLARSARERLASRKVVY